jgi:1,6-anhydro-N-acetylmuramate kinase
LDSLSRPQEKARDRQPWRVLQWTILPRHEGNSAAQELKEIKGFDVCACIQVLDLVAREALGRAFDEDGAAARSGRAAPHAADALYNVLARQRSGGRSLGHGR